MHGAHYDENRTPGGGSRVTRAAEMVPSIVQFQRIIVVRFIFLRRRRLDCYNYKVFINASTHCV
jgi:hypothetical protein